MIKCTLLWIKSYRQKKQSALINNPVWSFTKILLYYQSISKNLFKRILKFKHQEAWKPKQSQTRFSHIYLSIDLTLSEGDNLNIKKEMSL